MLWIGLMQMFVALFLTVAADNQGMKDKEVKILCTGASVILFLSAVACVGIKFFW